MRRLRNNRVIYNTDTLLVNASNRIIAVDFDGTLVRNRYPYIENPNDELLDFIRKNRSKYTWILWTCRHDEQLAYAVNWLRDEQNIVFDFVNANVPWKIEQYGDCRKIYADYYIDDKNVSLEQIING